MKKILFFSSLLILAGSVGAEQVPAATGQMHNAMTQSLANTTYYDEVHANMPNAHGTATKDNLNGEAEYMRAGVGAPFDVSNPGGAYLNGGKPTHVENYVTHTTDESQRTVIMKSPVSVPPVSDPVDVSDNLDDLFLDALGGESAVSASQTSGYQGSYETAVGEKKEKAGFEQELAKTTSQNIQKQTRADAEYRALNASQPKNSSSGESGFWGTLGKNILQGVADSMTGGTAGSGTSSGGSGSCMYGDYQLPAEACRLCVQNKPRSQASCSACCNATGRRLMQPASYSAVSSGGRPSGCLCRFGPTSGLRF